MVSIGVYGISDNENNKKNKCWTSEEGESLISFEIDNIRYCLTIDEMSRLKDLVLYHDKCLDDYNEEQEE